MKKIAIKSLIILFVVVFVCLFFGKTLQTLTTPKVRFTHPQQGRMVSEQKIETKLFYPTEVEKIVKLAEKYPIKVTAVYFNIGNTVDVGDVIFDATINDYEKKQKDINDEIIKKTEELLDLDSKNSKYPKTSQKNDLYNAYLDANQELLRAKASEESRARLAGEEPKLENYDLQQKALNKAKNAYDQISKFASVTGDEVFEYIKKRDSLLKEIKDRQKDAVDLDYANKQLSEIKADAKGIITNIDIKPGEEYSGGKSLYNLAPIDTPPVLRAIVKEINEVPQLGEAAKVKTDWGTTTTEVVKTGKDKDGQRFVDFKLVDDIVNANGGLKAMMGDVKINATITKRATRVTTLIPASALRQDGDSTFVYIASWTDGGIMSSYYVAKKQKVTVIEKTDENISVSESFYDSVIDREDRAISENARVMENKQ